MKRKLTKHARLLTLRFCALLLMSVGAAMGAEAETTYKLQQVSSVQAGKLYVFEQKKYVMNNSVSNNALQCVSSYKSTGLAGTESYVWTLESKSGGFYMKNVNLTKSAYLNNTSSTDLSFGSKSSVWSFSFNNNVCTIQNTSNSNRFLGFTTTSSHEYKAYATSNLSGTSYPHAITVYELVEETSSGTSTKTEPTLPVSDQTVAYGTNYTLDTSGFSCGDITLVSAFTSIATVNGLTLTPQAVGSTRVTVNAAANDIYEAGTASFTLTVTAPSASDSNTGAVETIFYESFDKTNGNGGNDNKWSLAGSGELTPDNDWVKDGSYSAASKCIKIASDEKNGTLTTPSLNTSNGITYNLTFNAGSWTGKSSTLSLSGSKTGTLSQNSFNLEDNKFKTYNVSFTATGSDATVTFTAEKGNQLFLDEVLITTPITSTSVTTSGGLATYCYQYPLNLDGISGAKAYKVSGVDVEGRIVRMQQITGTIKGGVPFILKSDSEDGTFVIPLAESSDVVPEGNALVGTLAPTFVEQTSDEYTNFAYSKSNGCFVKLGESGNTVPANRAYLPIALGGNGGQVKSFALSFDFVDGIDGMENGGRKMDGGVYNLGGQRMRDGFLGRGVYIVNGRRVVIK